ncbi:MAG: conjugal transfer protein TraB, partial [Halobacteria archaeon]|nr:conjugal transfer protein TraB [Halobacteria archaeon]
MAIDDDRDEIDEEEPDVVDVELDEKRYQSIKGETRDDIKPKELIQGNKPFEFLVYWLLSYLQAKMGDEFGIEPGADMMAAID